MKSPSLALLNFLNFQSNNLAPLAVWCAHILKAATVNCPKAVPVAPAQPAVAAQPAILAQTAKPARAASAAVTGAANTTGYAFGELYLNSPAYPAGTPIPAIPAKPASNAVLPRAAVIGKPAKPAVVAPVIIPLPGMLDAITIERGADYMRVLAYLPVAANVLMVGSTTDSSPVLEITPPNLQPTDWVGLKATLTDEVVPGNVLPNSLIKPTLEEMFVYVAGLCIGNGLNAGSISNAVHQFGDRMLPCKVVDLKVAANVGAGYTPNGEVLPLPFLSYFIDSSGGDGNGSRSVVAQ
jgi:hypothetical protein